MVFLKREGTVNSMEHVQEIHLSSIQLNYLFRSIRYNYAKYQLPHIST